MSKRRLKQKPVQSLLQRAILGEPDAVRKVMRLVIKHGGENAVRRSG